MQEASKAGLVKEIRGILDSTPNGLDCRQIESDYRNLVGKPLKKQLVRLGHNDLESFLLVLSREGSVKQEQHYNSYLYRAAAADNSTTHLQALVKKQVKKSKRGAPTRRPSPTPPRPKVLPKPMQDNVLTLLREEGQLPMSRLIKAYHDRYGVTFNYKSYGFFNLKDAMLSVEQLDVEWKGSNAYIRAKPISGTVSPSMSGVSLYAPAVGNIKETLCMNITKVLGDEEIALGQLAQRYSSVIGKPCNPLKYGFNSWLSLVNSLVDTVNLRRGDQDEWLVSHVSRLVPAKEESVPSRKPLSDDLVSLIRRFVESKPNGVFVDSFDERFMAEMSLELSPSAYGYKSMECLLTDVLTTDMEIVATLNGCLIRVKPPEVPVGVPEIVDAVGPGVRYNKPQLPPLDQYIELRVSDINTPSDFHVQLMPNKNAGMSLERLMDELERVYDALEAGNVYRLPSQFVKPGQVVVCRYPNDSNWHRAQITRVLCDNFAQVLFVDYGTECAVQHSALFYLRTQFLKLSMQAQSATLYGIAPAEEHGWTNKAVKLFFSLSAGKCLCAMVRAIDKEQKLAMCLSDVNNGIDIHINEYLVTSQVAIFTDVSAQLPKSTVEKVDGVVNWDVSSDDESDSNNDLDPKVQPVVTAPQLVTSLQAVSISSSPSAPRVSKQSLATTMDTPTQSADQNTPTTQSLSAHPISFMYPLPTTVRPSANQNATTTSTAAIQASQPGVPPLESSPMRTQQTATVKPQMVRVSQPHVLAPQQQPPSLAGPPLYSQPLMAFQPRPPFLLPPGMAVPTMQYNMYAPQYSPYRHSYSVPPPSVYVPDPRYLNNAVPPLLTLNRSTSHHQHGHSDTRYQSAGGDGPPPLEPARDQPPPLEPIKSEKVGGPPPLVPSTQLDRGNSGDGPPPLVPAHVATAASQQTEMSSPRAGRSVTVETLKHRLKGLQLKRDRLRKEQSVAVSADDSGAEGSESEISVLESEIHSTTSQLAKMTGVPVDAAPVRKGGRGRSGLHIIAASSY